MSKPQTIIIKEWKKPKTQWQKISERINWATLFVAALFGCPLALLLSSYDVIK